MKPKWLTTIFEVPDKRTQSLDLSGKNVLLSSPSSSRNLNTLGQTNYLVGEDGTKLIRIK